MADTPIADQGWAQLVDVAAGERERRMEARFLELAKVSEEERRNSFHGMALSAYALPPETRVDFTRSRLRAWLRLDPVTAGPVAASYNATMDRMSGDAAWSRVSTAQAALKGFTPDQQTRLHELFPKEVPAVSLLIQTKEPAVEAKAGRRWPFGKK